MKAHEVNKNIRPGVLVVVAGVLAATGVAIWMYSAQRPASHDTAGSTAPSGPPADPPVARRAADTAEVAAIAEPPAPALPPAAPDPPKPLEEQWGIQISSISLAMNGYAVDLRYTVVAPEKAARLSEGKTKAYLIEQASGAQLQMFTPPPTGDPPPGVRAHSMARMARQGGAFPPGPNRLTAGKTNSFLLPNPEGAVKSGSKVAVVIGNSRLDGVTVE